LKKRKIPIQTRSVAGHFYSHKNKRLVQFESQLEKKCFLLLEFDDNVVSYIEQPLKIDKYFPDILVKQYANDKLDVLIEVKYFKEIENPTDKLKEKFKKLEEYCLTHNLKFEIFTERKIEEPYFSNISLIYNYSEVKVPTKFKETILDQFDKSPEKRFKDLLTEKIQPSYIYALIFQKDLEINLYKKISKESIIRRNL